METGVIYNEDCMETMARMEDDYIDLILTDPPYGTGKASGTKGKSRAEKTKYTKKKYNTEKYVIKKIIPAIKECLRVSKRLIVTPGVRHLTKYPQPDSFGCIYQPATCGMQKWGRADSQPIFYYGRDPRLGKTISRCSIQCTERPAEVDHPCPKPTKLWSEL